MTTWVLRQFLSRLKARTGQTLAGFVSPSCATSVFERVPAPVPLIAIYRSVAPTASSEDQTETGTASSEDQNYSRESFFVTPSMKPVPIPYVVRDAPETEVIGKYVLQS